MAVDFSDSVLMHELLSEAPGVRKEGLSGRASSERGVVHAIYTGINCGKVNPSMVTNIGSALKELVAAVIESVWPQEEDEYRDWAIGLGLPDVGEPVVFPRDDAQIRRFQSLWKNEVNIGWSFYQGKFVGLSIITMIDLEDIDLGQSAAEYLRRAWRQHYGAGEALDDPIRGFTELWELGELRLDYYWHIPRWVEEFSAPISGGIQIEIDRTILADLVAAMTANA